MILDSLKARLLPWLKVPAEPEPPAGSPGSVKVFRAAPNFYRLKLFLWVLRQLSGVVGIIAFLIFWSSTVGRRAPDGVQMAVGAVELLGILGFLLQLPVSYLLVRLDYEMRWYIVTDRSLRIRSGVVSVRETTLTFANIQHLTVGQGPLQRWLGIYDLEVTTAGGGAGGSAHHGQAGQGDSMHRGFFHGINNAPEVRELILERLRRFRDAGLGDPDEAHSEESSQVPSSGAGADELLAAANGLLVEVRRLRTAVEAG